jgi:hypothetical protein
MPESMQKSKSVAGRPARWRPERFAVGADRALIDAVSEGLTAAADPIRAPQMQAYMKSAMPYLGVPLPTVRSILKASVRAHPPKDIETLTATAQTLWREATHRD